MAIFDAIIGFFQDVWNSIYVLLFSSNNIIFSAIDILIVTFIVYKVASNQSGATYKGYYRFCNSLFYCRITTIKCGKMDNFNSKCKLPRCNSGTFSAGTSSNS